MITKTETPRRWFQSLYIQVLFAITVGIILGYCYPTLGESMKLFGDGFIKLIKMLIAPLIFLTVVNGIAGIGDLKKLGSVGWKAFLYFEIVSTFALTIGLIVVNIIKPGAGIHADVSTIDTSSITSFVRGAKEQSIADFFLHIIPDTVVSAFAEGNILQVLCIALLFGISLTKMGERGAVIARGCDKVAHVMFGIVALVMKVAPLGAFGAMAFTVGKYGVQTLLPLLNLMFCVYITCGVFIFLILGIIARYNTFRIIQFLRYIREEIVLVLGTSSSESALPRMMEKLERLGCSKPVVGLVIPSGYSFNLDGTSIYLTMAAVFIAQATDTPLTLIQEITLLAVLMLTSKGAATVTGGGFITLAATLSSLGTIPVAGMTLLLGVDRFMSEARAITNLIGNGIATIVVARWEGELNHEQLHQTLSEKS